MGTVSTSLRVSPFKATVTGAWSTASVFSGSSRETVTVILGASSAPSSPPSDLAEVPTERTSPSADLPSGRVTVTSSPSFTDPLSATSTFMLTTRSEPVVLSTGRPGVDLSPTESPELSIRTGPDAKAMFSGPTKPVSFSPFASCQRSTASAVRPVNSSSTVKPV
jgi:hypothetical protein